MAEIQGESKQKDEQDLLRPCSPLKILKSVIMLVDMQWFAII
jgi:hypothetical protein